MARNLTTSVELKKGSEMGKTDPGATSEQRAEWRRRKQLYRDQLRAAGLVKVEVWVPRDQVEQVKRLGDRLRASYKRR
jgi:hypothetical protein